MAVIGGFDPRLGQPFSEAETTMQAIQAAQGMQNLGAFQQQQAEADEENKLSMFNSLVKAGAHKDAERFWNENQLGGFTGVTIEPVGKKRNLIQIKGVVNPSTNQPSTALYDVDEDTFEYLKEAPKERKPKLPTGKLLSEYRQHLGAATRGALKGIDFNPRQKTVADVIFQDPLSDEARRLQPQLERMMTPEQLDAFRANIDDYFQRFAPTPILEEYRDIQARGAQERLATPPQIPAEPTREPFELEGAPDPVANTGRIIRDEESGQRYESDGTSWRPIQ
jgi:hypothetical protein